MKRSHLINKFSNKRSDLDRKAYNKQRNYVVSLLRKEKKQFYSNLKNKVLTENRTFFAKYICDDINALIHSLKFHNELKEGGRYHTCV